METSFVLCLVDGRRLTDRRLKYSNVKLQALTSIIIQQRGSYNCTETAEEEARTCGGQRERESGMRMMIYHQDML